MSNETAKTLGGEWEATTYEVYDKTLETSKNGEGCKMQLRFRPNQFVTGSNIALVQVLLGRKLGGKNHDEGLRKALEKGGCFGAAHRAKAERTDGIGHLDRSVNANNPVYGAPTLPKGSDIERTAQGLARSLEPGGTDKTYRLGKQGTAGHRAKLHDEPISDGNADDDDFMAFETAAVSIKGNQKYIWYGSVSWGWQKKGGSMILQPLKAASMSVPSKHFVSLVTVWNNAHDKNGDLNIQLPVPTIGDLFCDPEEMANAGKRAKKQTELNMRPTDNLSEVTMANLNWTKRNIGSFR